MIKSSTFSSLNLGKKLVLLGGIHGNETCGPVAMRQIMDELNSGKLTLKKGSITFIPECNPQAARLDTRFVDENLNRVFCLHENPQSYESRLANAIIPLIESADYILDLHSFHVPGNSIVFQDYPGQERTDFASVQGVEYLILGFAEVYQDAAVQADSTETYAYKAGKIAITVEAGCHKDPDCVPRIYEMILNSMKYLGLIEGVPVVPEAMKKIHLQQVIMKRKAGHLSQNFDNIHPLRQGDVVAVYEDGESFVMPWDGFVFMPNPVAFLNQEWFYIGKNIK